MSERHAALTRSHMALRHLYRTRLEIFVWPEMIYIWSTLGASFVTETSPLCYPVDARDVDFGRIPYEKERACG